MAHEFVFGLVGPVCTANARKTWNELLQKEEIDGFFDFYRTTDAHALVTRFSEMFLLGRRGYLISEPLQAAATPLMDALDSTVQNGRVDMVMNERGVLTGYFSGKAAPEEILEIWMRKPVSD